MQREGLLKIEYINHKGCIKRTLTPIDMKILVPNFALDWDNEYEKLFMAVMYGVATEGGFQCTILDLS